MSLPISEREHGATGKSGAYANPIDERTAIIDVKNLIHQEENIYYNFSFVNQQDVIVDAIFNDNRNTPILQKPSNFKAAIVRFECSTDDIPMFRTVEEGYFAVSLYYFPDNLSSTIELFNGVPTLIFTFSDLIDAPQGLNAKLLEAFNSLVTQYEVIHGPGSWVTDGNPEQAPFVIFNQATNLFVFYNDPASIDSNPDGVQVYLSRELHRLFEGIPNSIRQNYYGYNNPALQRVTWEKVYYYIQPNDANVVTLGVGTDPVVAMTQNYQSIEAWWKVKKVVLVSESVGIRSESVATSFSNGNNVVYNILTDFTMELNTTDSSPATQLRYIPSAEYRILDLINDVPLSSINIQVYTQDVFGTLRRLRLLPGDSFSGKILFTKSIAH